MSVPVTVAEPTIIDARWFWDGIFVALKALLTIWWVFPLMLIPVIPDMVLRLWEIRTYAKAGLPEIDRMTGRQFEEWLARFFRSRGYDVALTPEQGDYGADLILKKGPVTTVVQAKRWSGKVGVSAIQKITAAKGYYKADSAMVVTNSFFTKEAIELARRNNVVLWDRKKLTDEILAEQAKKAAARNQSSTKRVAVKSVGKTMVHAPRPSDVGRRAPCHQVSHVIAAIPKTERRRREA